MITRISIPLADKVKKEMIIQKDDDHISITIHDHTNGNLDSSRYIYIYKNYYKMFMDYLRLTNFAIDERKSINWDETWYKSEKGGTKICINPIRKYYDNHNVYTIKLYQISQGENTFMITPESFSVFYNIMKIMCND